VLVLSPGRLDVPLPGTTDGIVEGAVEVEASEVTLLGTLLGTLLVTLLGTLLGVVGVVIGTLLGGVVVGAATKSFLAESEDFCAASAFNAVASATALFAGVWF
jgi:hypothetical protein